MAAHQVIFIPAGTSARNGAQGTVYVFGGLETFRNYQPNNCKYDIAKNKWTTLEKWKPGEYRLSFNLIPLCNFKLILIVSKEKNYLFDTECDKFIRLQQDGHSELFGVQIGAFTLPIIGDNKTSVSESPPEEVQP